MTPVKSRRGDISNDKGVHNLSFVTASAFIPNSFSDNTNNVLIVPACGLNFDYQISR